MQRCSNAEDADPLETLTLKKTGPPHVGAAGRFSRMKRTAGQNHGEKVSDHIIVSGRIEMDQIRSGNVIQIVVDDFIKSPLQGQRGVFCHSGTRGGTLLQTGDS